MSGTTTSPTAQVTRLYDTVFKRPPDSEGFAHWVNTLQSGRADLDEVAEVFVASSEFQATYGALNNGEFVALLYRNVLGRPGDPEGQAHWTSTLQSGALDRHDVVVQFSESPEHVAMLGAAAVVSITGENALI